MLISAPPPLGAAVRLPCAALEDELGVWLLDVGDLPPRWDDLSVLDATERGRAARLTRPDDRASYVAAHVLLRQLLGERLGLPPEDVAFTREPCVHCGAAHGRPVLVGARPGLHFSVSRRGSLVLAGVARAPIGVDVEAVAEQETVTTVTSLLHDAERREIMFAAPTEQAERFTRVWVRKEAYLKGVGAGVAGDLAAEDVGRVDAANGPSGWVIVALPLPAGYAGAVAWSSPTAGQAAHGTRARGASGPAERVSPHERTYVVSTVGTHSRPCDPLDAPGGAAAGRRCRRAI